MARMSIHNSNLILQPAVAEDVPTLVDIEFAAFRDEKVNQQLSYRDAGNPSHRAKAIRAYKKAMNKALLADQNDLQLPRWNHHQKPFPRTRSDSVLDPVLDEECVTRRPVIHFTKVVDGDTGNIIAFSKIETTALSSADLKQPLAVGHEGEPGVNQAWFSLNEKLRREFNWTRRHCYFGMLATHPDHQRKGAGSKLLEIILEKNSNVDIYLEATARGRPLYEKYGFETVHELIFDPAEYGLDIGIEHQTVMVKRSEKHQ